MGGRAGSVFGVVMPAPLGSEDACRLLGELRPERQGEATEQSSVWKKGTFTDGRSVPKIAVGDIEGDPRAPLEQVERLISAVSVETPKSCRAVLLPSSFFLRPVRPTSATSSPLHFFV